MQRKRASVYLSLYSDLGILQPPMKYEERFFIPSNRITDCRASEAARNENWPDSPTVERNEGRRKTTKMKTIVRKVTLGLVALCVLIGLMAVSGCGEGSGDDSIGAIVGLVPPPVSVTFRESLMKGYVLQLHNRSSNRITARVYVENKLLNQSKSVAVGIAPNEMNELGILEMDWAFMPGGKWSSFCRRIYKRNIF